LESKEASEVAFIIKRNIGPELYYLVRNLNNPLELWDALNKQFGAASKSWVRNKKRELSEVTIESCRYNVDTYLRKKIDAIDELIAVNVNVKDAEMCDSILAGLEPDYRFSDFIFFYSSQEIKDYLDLVAKIQEYSESKAFKRKFGRQERTKSKLEAHNVYKKSPKRKVKCSFCKKDGHTEMYCYSNPNSKSFKGKKFMGAKDTSNYEADKDKTSLVSLFNNKFLGYEKTDIIVDELPIRSTEYYGNRYCQN
jgi:hypothetical protein